MQEFILKILLFIKKILKMEDKLNYFEKAFKHTLHFEGGYVNDPDDLGSKTKYGITKGVAKNHGYQGGMKDFPLGFAKEIYKKSYWDKNKLNEIVKYDPNLALELFDSGVNCGTTQAAKWLQRCLNFLNREESLYKNIKDDGIVGNVTLSCFQHLQRDLDKDSLYKMLNIMQGYHYISICNRKESQEKFIRGWLRRVIFSKIIK